MLIYLQGKYFLQKAYTVITGLGPENKQKALISALACVCVVRTDSGVCGYVLC